MEPIEVLGAVAHPGGMLVRRPELTVGVVRAVSRPSGLALELLARTPQEGAAPAPRRLLPAYDEGMNLRVGSLDQGGRARWEYTASSSGTTRPGVATTYRGVYVLPPLFGEMALVLAWPEIGFPETVIRLPLPERGEVEHAATSVWTSPRVGVPVTEEFDRRVADIDPGDVAWEEGSVVVPPTVLHGSDDAVIVLARLTDHGSLLSLELLSLARGMVALDAADSAASAYGPMGPPPSDYFPSSGGAAIAVVRGRAAHRLRLSGGGSTGGLGSFTADAEYTVPRPDSGVLDLLVSWPVAGLAEVRVRVDLAG
jgi:hypothetical protein